LDLAEVEVDEPMKGEARSKDLQFVDTGPISPEQMTRKQDKVRKLRKDS
jgi:hypothetical protein